MFWVFFCASNFARTNDEEYKKCPMNVKFYVLLICKHSSDYLEPMLFIDLSISEYSVVT